MKSKIFLSEEGVHRGRERKKDEAEERRVSREWDLSNPNIDDEGLKAHALLNYLEYENDVEVLSEEDRLRTNEIRSQIDDLTKQYNEQDNPNIGILDTISELEDELEEYSKKIDVYHIIPIGEFYEMTRFEVVNSPVEGNEYVVGTESEMDETAYEYVENLIEEIGYDGFSKGFLESHIDDDSVIEHARDTYQYDVEESPDSYLDDSDRNLSDEQEDRINFLKNKNEKLSALKLSYQEVIDNSDDQEKIEKLETQIEEIEDLIIENEDEIEEMEENPEGEYNQDAIDNKVNQLINDVRNNSIWYINEMGLDVNDFIDKDSFIEDVIESDGYGIVNSYNGSYDDQKINGQLYYIMRVN